MIIACPFCRTQVNLPEGMRSFQCPSCKQVVNLTNAPAPQPNPTKPAYGAPKDPATAYSIVAQGAQEINVSQMHSAFELAGLYISSDICNQFLLKYDADHSGRINFSEFSSIMQEINQWSNVFSFFDSDHSGKMEFKEFCDALMKMGYQFSQQITNLMFTNLDQNRVGYLDLDSFVRACSVIQIIIMKMQQYDPQRRGAVTLDLNQMMDVIFSVPL